MYDKFGKRLFDLLLALMLLPIGLLIGLPVALLIFLEDQGSALYLSERRGVNGQTFRFYKFRSMVMNAPDIRNADNSTLTSATDPRITRIGMVIRRTSIDELPQILNVIKGDMSFIGPRPNMATTPYGSLSDLERKRISIKPGLTGYSQAFFRNSVTANEKCVQDIWYLENLTFLLDVRIVLETFRTVISQRDINASS